MKILHVVPAVTCGGAERVLADIIRTTQAHYDHFVLSMTSGDAFFDLSGVELFSLDLKRGSYSMTGIRRFRELVRELEPSVIHAWLYHGNALSCFAPDCGARIIWSIHNTDLPIGLAKTSTRLVNRIGAFCSAAVPARIVYAGHEARRIHENIGYSKDRGVVVDNGVDLGKFRRDATMRKVARRFLDAKPSNYVIGMIGRFDSQKDHSTMIRAFAKVREHRDAILAIVGPDCTLSNEQLRSLIRSAGVEPHVRLLGQRPDIATLMNGFDVLAISSRYGEAMPMVALEAAATDLPVVATRVGDVGEFLLDDGHLASPGASGSLASALLEVAQCLPFPASLVENRRRKLRAKYSIECMAQNYLALYRALTIKYPRVQSASQLSSQT